MEGPKTLIPGARSYLVKQLGQTLTLKTLITMFYIHHFPKWPCCSPWYLKESDTEQQQYPPTKEVWAAKGAVTEDLLYAKLGFDIINSQQRWNWWLR